MENMTLPGAAATPTPSIDFNPEAPAAVNARRSLKYRSGASYVPYHYDAAGSIVLHVRIALATGRPLLLSGHPGAGKSTLARDVALCLGWRYYERVVTSRTQARDLQWRWDAVARLADAQGERKWLNAPWRFVEPGVLWWAASPATARVRGASSEVAAEVQALDPAWQFLAAPPAMSASSGAVVLLDEIDKADPDVPNDLLVAVGESRFEVEETGADVRRDPTQQSLVVLTTNGERDLPPAFLRRCITIELALPEGKAMADIVQSHVPQADPEVITRLVGRHATMVEATSKAKARPPSTAELIDAVRAATVLLESYPSNERTARLEQLLQATLWKRPEAMPLATTGAARPGVE